MWLKVSESLSSKLFISLCKIVVVTLQTRCSSRWNIAAVTAAFFLFHLSWQRKKAQGRSFPAFPDRAVPYSQPKVVQQPPHSLRSEDHYSCCDAWDASPHTVMDTDSKMSTFVPWKYSHHTSERWSHRSLYESLFTYRVLQPLWQA